jgi:hypothetical protein
VPVKGHVAHRQLVQAAQLTRKLQVNRSTGQDITAQCVRMQSARYEVRGLMSPKIIQRASPDSVAVTSLGRLDTLHNQPDAIAEGNGFRHNRS